jgi:CubicO group peptidase (beta-lactamase class C family)
MDSVLQSHPQFNGAVLIMKQDSVVGKAVQGIAKPDGTPLNVDSPFNLASVAKHITALAAAHLMNENKLEYNAPVSKYLPHLKATKYDSIQISDLIHHTSGLADYGKLFKKFPSYATPFASNSSLLNLIRDKEPELIFEPGSDYEYSNTGYIILASVIEKISGMSFGEYLKQTFFEPLQMKNSFGYSHAYPNQHPERVTGLKFSKDTIVNDLNTLDGVIGDGNIYMSINDFVKWERFLNSEDLLSEKWRKLYFSPGRELPEGADPYAFGWIVFEDREVMQHAGGWVGFNTFYFRDQKNGTTMVGLSNGSITNEDFSEILTGINKLRKELIPKEKI